MHTRIQTGGKGIIIAGKYGELLGREKQGETLELGELLVSRDDKGEGMLLQVTDLQYGSQISQQNRELLEKLATQTGGQYYKPDQLAKLSGEIAYSEAGISIRETRDLWNMPALFLIALVLRSAEWLLRRKWGII